MDEAKTLVGHAVSAMFAALILAAVLALIYTGHIVWRAFSRQNDANYRMKEYSKYSAFDGTEVRGQDVIALLHDTQGDPYVVIVAVDSNAEYKPVMTAYNSITSNCNLNDVKLDTNDTASGIIASLASPHSTLTVKSLIPDGIEHTESYDYSDVSKAPKYSEVQEFFLDRGAQAGDGVAGYTKYESYLLYDSDATTDIVGILLKEMSPDGGGN